MCELHYFFIFFIMNSSNFNHGHFKFFVINRQLVFCSDAFLKALTIRPEYFVFNKRDVIKNCRKVYDRHSGVQAYGIAEKNFEIRPLNLVKTFQNLVHKTANPRLSRTRINYIGRNELRNEYHFNRFFVCLKHWLFNVSFSRYKEPLYLSSL